MPPFYCLICAASIGEALDPRLVPSFDGNAISVGREAFVCSEGCERVYSARINEEWRRLDRIREFTREIGGES